MKPLVPVVFATDDGFAPYCSVAVASLIANQDPERCYAIHIFYDELSQEHLDRLGAMGAENVTVECLQISSFVDREALYTINRLTRAIYYRFFAADVLPRYDKLVYLDSDIVLLGDVGELFDIDIGDNLLGGVVNYKGTSEEKRIKYDYLTGTVGVLPEEYINSGVLVMNLRSFRQEGIGEKCVRYVREHPDLRWMDQDALNAVCKGRIHYIDIRWNRSQLYFEDEREDGLDVSDTKVLHYLSSYKPWMVDFRVSHIPFYQYALLTPYAAEIRERLLDNNRERTTHRNHTRRREAEAAEKRAAERAVAKAAAQEQAARRKAEQERLAEERRAQRRAEQERLAEERRAQRKAEQERLAAERAAAAEARKAAQQAAIERKAAALAKTLVVSSTREQMLQMAQKGQLGPRFLLKCCWRWLKGRLSGR